jgi:cold-inducible RNA-binding protein
MRKVFVASISWNTDENGLSNHFSQIGEIEDVVIVKDKETRRSRGFGFVTFTNADDADRAVKELDNSVLDGRNIKVNLAKERE